MAPFDLLAFWKTNEYVYPTLSKIAKRILCILPTSCPSERVYSVCDTVITKKRNRMTDATAKQLVFIKAAKTLLNR